MWQEHVLAFHDEFSKVAKQYQTEIGWFLATKTQIEIISTFLLMDDDVIHEGRRQSNGTHSLTRFWLIYSLKLD